MRGSIACICNGTSSILIDHLVIKPSKEIQGYIINSRTNTTIQIKGYIEDNKSVLYFYDQNDLDNPYIEFQGKINHCEIIGKFKNHKSQKIGEFLLELQSEFWNGKISEAGEPHEDFELSLF